MNYLIRSLCAFGLVSTLQSAAAELSVQQIKLEHPANGSVVKLKDRPLLLVSGHNVEHRWLSLVDLQNSQAKQIAIPKQLQFFQQAKLAKAGGAVQHAQLVALGQQGIWQYDESNQRWSLLTQVASAYPVIDQKRFSQLSFTEDFNNDQLTDFLVPDFAFWHVLMQQKDGSFRQFSLPMDAEVQLFREDPEFRLKTAYRLDFNADGLTDVLFQRDDQLWLYRQQADGSFSTQADIIPLGIGLTPDAQAQQRSGDGRDYKGLTVRVLANVQDLNNDKVPDLVVREQHYASALEQKYQYQFHYGQLANGKVVHGKTFDQQINTNGVQFDVEYKDLDADGLADFYTPAVELGIGKIVGALLSGSATVDWLFYKQRKDGSFGSKPVYQQEVEVAFSLSSGQTSLPVTAVLKNKAGLASLVKADGEDVLRVYAPVQAQLFSQKSSRQSLLMPKQATNLLVTDLDGDGDDDLVLPYGLQENKAEQRNQLLILRQP